MQHRKPAHVMIIWLSLTPEVGLLFAAGCEWSLLMGGRRAEA